MPRYTQPKRTQKYSNEFKIKAVKLSQQEGIQVKQVAEGLDIHPFMLSRWRKEYREGTLKRAGTKRIVVEMKKLKTRNRELTENARLKKENEKLRQENDLLKKWQRYLAEIRQNDSASSKDTEK